MTADQIAKAIRYTNWTNSELSQFIDAVKYARAQLTRQNIWSFTVGDRVTFNSAKLGFVAGTVEKVAIKYVTVRTPRGLYKVPANMLEQGQRAVA